MLSLAILYSMLKCQSRGIRTDQPVQELTSVGWCMQAPTFCLLSTATNDILISIQSKKNRTTRSQELVQFDPAPVDTVKIEFEMAACYQQRAASSTKRKQVALKAIKTNFNDPAIEKAILHQIIMSHHPINDKENKSVDLLLPRGGKSKASLYRCKEANTSIMTGLSTIFGQRAKIA
jgi:hypothetical protein